MLDSWEREETRLDCSSYGGETSEGERLTRRLSHQADAIAAFDWLANQSTLVAKLYAYWALRTLAPEHAQAHETELRNDHRRVMTFQGCIGARYHTRYLLREVERRPMPAPVVSPARRSSK